jgi:hypothetical protein
MGDRTMLLINGPWGILEYQEEVLVEVQREAWKGQMNKNNLHR